MERDIILDLGAACAAHGERRLGIVGYSLLRNEKAHCPVQMHFGKADAGIPMRDVALIREAQSNAEIYTYPKARNGFGCDERAHYSRDGAVLAECRTVAFLARHLAPGPA